MGLRWGLDWDDIEMWTGIRLGLGLDSDSIGTEMILGCDLDWKLLLSFTFIYSSESIFCLARLCCSVLGYFLKQCQAFVWLDSVVACWAIF